MEQHERPKFDPQAALEELERFGRDIQRYRAEREAVGDRFESFVQSFKTPVDPAVHADRPLVARPRELPGEPVPAPVPPAPMAAPPQMPVFETPATELSPPAMTPPPEVVPAAVAAPAAKPPIATIAAGTAILLGGGLLAAILWNRQPETPASETTADAPAAALPAPVTSPAPSADAPAAATAPPPVAAAPPPALSTGASELIADRRVWIRVTADGARVLERELPAGARIPITAEKTIVIRTGDAGAVRLSVRGAAPVPLGREGEVVTRSFAVPPRSEAVR